MAEGLLAKVPDKVKSELDNMAQETGLSTERLVATLLEGFIEGEGKVYTGRWTEGPGIRLLPDWPRFTAKVYHVKKADMK